MKKIIALILTFFLTACTSFLSDTTPTETNKTIHHYLPWASRKAQLKALTGWQASGNIAAHTENQCGANALFHWQQTGKNYRLRLYGPIGTQGVLLVGNSQQATLLVNNRVMTADNAERLLSKQLGLYLPVSQLPYWLRGLPAPGSRYTVTLDAYNHLLTLNQSGWHANYMQFTNSQALDLPEYVELCSGKWRVKILVQHWTLPTSSPTT